VNDLLTDADVDRIVRLMASLEGSTFDFLQLDIGELRVSLGKGDPAPVTGSAPAAAVTAAPPAPAASEPTPSAAAPAAEVPVAAAAPPAPAVAPPAAAGDTVEITAPIMGLYYAQPEPGADPYVQVGSTVTTEMTVALIEVMKTFNAVAAGVSGEVVEVCVENSQFVEFGQVLYRVRPS
jgi:acetyl-CoA carboxylase biotin carboxyl carrier protein